MNALAEHAYADLLRRVRRYGLAAGVLGLLGGVAGLFVSAPHFFQGYLFAFVYWLGLSLGCLALLMLHHIVAGSWGFVTQRLLEAGALTVGLMALLFVPLLFGLGDLYEWTHPEAVAGSEVLQHKTPYLNVPFFIIRAVLYFAFWIAAAYLLRRWSLRLDATGDAAHARRMRRLGVGGLIAHILLLTFASVDWIMSLEPHWFSTMFGWLLAVSQSLTALALVILTAVLLAKGKPLSEVFQTKHLHDYGNLLLAFVVLWAYMMFAQYLIIWAGNIPEDVQWFVHRQEGAWSWVGPFLIVFHFAVPFAVLLSRRTKRSRRALRILAGGLLVVHAVYVAWLVWPSFLAREDAALSMHTFWIGAVAFLGVGGLWAAVYAWVLGRAPVLPLRDPRFTELPRHLQQT